MVCLQRFRRVNWGQVQREWTSQLGGHWEFRELWGAGGPVQARLWVPLGSLGGAAGRAWRSDCWLGGPTSHHMASLSPVRRQFLSPRAQPRLPTNPRPSRPRWLSHRDLRLHVAELSTAVCLLPVSPPPPPMNGTALHTAARAAMPRATLHWSPPFTPCTLQQDLATLPPKQRPSQPPDPVSTGGS